MPDRDIAGILDEAGAPAEAVRSDLIRKEKPGEQGGVAGQAEIQPRLTRQRKRIRFGLLWAGPIIEPTPFTQASAEDALVATLKRSHRRY